MELAILSATAFNRIPQFEQQVQTLQFSSLEAIGELFLSYEMHKDYCLGLLHRHYDLQDGEIMVHSSSSDGSDICRIRNMREMQHSKLVPHSLFLNGESNFQAFEYDLSVESRQIDSGFLGALRTLLISRGLKDIIAIAPHPKLSSKAYPIMETLLPEIRGMRSDPWNGHDRPKGHTRTAVVTSWMFQRDPKGAVKVQDSGKCIINSIGVHDYKPPNPPKSGGEAVYGG